MSVYSLHIEKEILIRVSESDEAAFEQLFYTCLPQAQRVVLGILRNENAVNDIIQEVFLNIWIDRGKLPGINSFSHWLFRLLYNRSINWIRKETLRRQDGDLYAGNELRINPNDTEEAVLFSETSRLVAEAIRNLTPQVRKVYRLSREQGLSIAEIAGELGLSNQTVKNLTVKAGKSIRKYLQDHGVDIPLVLITFHLKDFF